MFWFACNVFTYNSINMIKLSQLSKGRLIASWLMCSCLHMFAEEPFLNQKKCCAWALFFCILFCNLPSTFLCFCVDMKCETWNRTLADTKEQQLAQYPKVLEKNIFSCGFLTFRKLPFNPAVGKEIHFLLFYCNIWLIRVHFTWQMNGKSLQIFQKEG